MISHDRWFLDRVCTHTMAFEGDSQVFFYPGNYTEYEEDRKKRLGSEAEQPHRIRYLAQALEHVVSHDDVWLATGAEIADWFMAHHLQQPGVRP